MSELKELVGDFEAVCEKWREWKRLWDLLEAVRGKVQAAAMRDSELTAAMNEMSDIVRTNILEIRSRALTSFEDVKLGMLGMFAEEPKRCDRQSADGSQKEAGENEKRSSGKRKRFSLSTAFRSR